MELVVKHFSELHGEVFAGMVYVLRSGSVTAAVQPVEKGDIEKLMPGVSVDLSR